MEAVVSIGCLGALEQDQLLVERVLFVKVLQTVTALFSQVGMVNYTLAKVTLVVRETDSSCSCAQNILREGIVVIGNLVVCRLDKLQLHVFVFKEVSDAVCNCLILQSLSLFEHDINQVVKLDMVGNGLHKAPLITHQPLAGILFTSQFLILLHCEEHFDDFVPDGYLGVEQNFGWMLYDDLLYAGKGPLEYYQKRSLLFDNLLGQFILHEF